MAIEVGVSTLALALNGLLAEEAARVFEVTEEAVKKTAQDTVKEIRANAKAQFPEGSGDYAKSWAQKVASGKNARGKIVRVVYSKEPNYRIAHLLEKGHAKVNGGRVPGRPHIAPAAAKSERELVELIKRGIEQGGQ